MNDSEVALNQNALDLIRAELSSLSRSIVRLLTARAVVTFAVLSQLHGAISDTRQLRSSEPTSELLQRELARVGAQFPNVPELRPDGAVFGVERSKGTFTLRANLDPFQTGDVFARTEKDRAGWPYEATFVCTAEGKLHNNLPVTLPYVEMSAQDQSSSALRTALQSYALNYQKNACSGVAEAVAKARTSFESRFNASEEILGLNLSFNIGFWVFWWPTIFGLVSCYLYIEEARKRVLLEGARELLTVAQVDASHPLPSVLSTNYGTLLLGRQPSDAFAILLRATSLLLMGLLARIVLNEKFYDLETLLGGIGTTFFILTCAWGAAHLLREPYISACNSTNRQLSDRCLSWLLLSASRANSASRNISLKLRSCLAATLVTGSLFTPIAFNGCSNPASGFELLAGITSEASGERHDSIGPLSSADAVWPSAWVAAYKTSSRVLILETAGQIFYWVALTLAILLPILVWNTRKHPTATSALVRLLQPLSQLCVTFVIVDAVFACAYWFVQPLAHMSWIEILVIAAVFAGERHLPSVAASNRQFIRFAMWLPLVAIWAEYTRIIAIFPWGDRGHLWGLIPLFGGIFICAHAYSDALALAVPDSSALEFAKSWIRRVRWRRYFHSAFFRPLLLLAVATGATGVLLLRSRTPTNAATQDHLSACLAGRFEHCGSVRALMGEYSVYHHRAAHAYKFGCKGGNARSCNNLAAMYEKAHGVERDFSKATELYEMACTAGEGQGCRNLARLARQGVAGLSLAERQQILMRAATLLQQGCDSGHLWHCGPYAEMLDRGEGDLQPDTAKALMYAERACSAGEARACYSEAAILVHQNPPREDQWPKIASASRNACSAGIVEACYYEGLSEQHYWNQHSANATKNRSQNLSVT